MATADKPGCLVLSAGDWGRPELSPGGRQCGCGLFPFLGRLGAPGAGTVLQPLREARWKELARGRMACEAVA